jgi:hypothetical protein
MLKIDEKMVGRAVEFFLYSHLEAPEDAWDYYFEHSKRDFGVVIDVEGDYLKIRVASNGRVRSARPSAVITCAINCSDEREGLSYIVMIGVCRIMGEIPSGIIEDLTIGDGDDDSSGLSN